MEEYTKPPLTFEEQADLIISRGLKADRDRLIRRLKNVNYYRLSAYLYPFRITGSDNFQEKTTLDLVWKYYTFDRQLRLIVMDAIERVEISVRTQLIYNFAHRHGTFGFTDAKNLPLLDEVRFQKWLEDMREETKRSHETFLDHFKDKYGDHHKLPPLWMLGEVMSFGKMLTLFNGVDDELRRIIARQYGLEDKVLQSWLGALNVVRNICAHHGRLWNRELGFKPMIPRPNKYPQWQNPVKIPNNRLFGILTILEYMRKRTASTSHWCERLKALFACYPEIPLKCMGFPANWEESPIWGK
jgi:abortive infection bacteriophage resistance protein